MSNQYPVMEGAAPFYVEGNSVGLLVSHGFTGTTQSMRPLCEAYASEGYTVCGPRLKGHGTHYEDLEQTNYQDWISSIEEGYEWLKQRCDTIFVIGLSMGGSLALYMAEHHPEIRGISVINPGINIPAMEHVREIDGQNEARFLDAIGSDIKKPGVTELAYEKTPVRSVKEALTLMDKVRANLPKVTCPVLIFVSPEDHVVPADNAEIVFNEISSESKEVRQLKDSYHVATLDNDQQLIIDDTLDFIMRHLPSH